MEHGPFHGDGRPAWLCIKCIKKFCTQANLIHGGEEVADRPDGWTLQ
jgi:hypothetical protein